MPSPMSLIDPNSPQVQALMARNPNGVFASMLKNAWARNGTGPSNNVAGSNNAGGMSTTPNGIPSITAPSFSRYTGGNMTGQLVDATGTYSRGRNSSFSFSGGDQGANNNNGMFSNGSIASFAAGGMMTEQGTAVRPGEMMGNTTPAAGTGRTLPSARFKVDAQAPIMPPVQRPADPQLGVTPDAELTPQMIDQEAARFVQEHPEEAQKVQALIAMAIQTGELTPQELNTAVQLAKTALANPSAYPQVRQYAIKNGLGTEQDIPQQMDKGMLYILIVAGKSAQAVGPQGNAMQGQGPSPTMEGGLLPSYEKGGPTGDKAHLAKLHPREYVIPEDAVIYHGKKFLDRLVEQARTPPDAGGQK